MSDPLPRRAVRGVLGVACALQFVMLEEFARMRRLALRPAPPVPQPADPQAAQHWLAVQALRHPGIGVLYASVLLWLLAWVARWCGARGTVLLLCWTAAVLLLALVAWLLAPLAMPLFAVLVLGFMLITGSFAH